MLNFSCGFIQIAFHFNTCSLKAVEIQFKINFDIKQLYFDSIMLTIFDCTLIGSGCCGCFVFVFLHM